MKNVKNISLLLLVALFAVTAAVGCEKKGNTTDGNDTPQTEVQANTKEEVVGDKTLGVFQFTNTSLIWQNGTTALETTVTNTSDSDATLKEFLIHVKDNDGNEITTMPGFVGDVIKAHETKTINSYHYANLTNAASIEYEVVE